MKLTNKERETLLTQLREEAVEQDRQMGCTCEPTMTLTPQGVGPHNLPMWISEHSDSCELTRRFKGARFGGHTHSRQR